jgi:hypothetical protein
MTFSGIALPADAWNRYETFSVMITAIKADADFLNRFSCEGGTPWKKQAPNWC